MVLCLPFLPKPGIQGAGEVKGAKTQKIPWQLLHKNVATSGLVRLTTPWPKQGQRPGARYLHSRSHPLHPKQDHLGTGKPCVL